MQLPKFKADDIVLHKKTGRTYKVFISANQRRLEANAAPAYAYCLAGDTTVWVRAAVEMEDGRFELCPGLA